MKYFLLSALAVVGFAAMPASEAKAGVVIDLGGGSVIVFGNGNRHRHDRCDDDFGRRHHGRHHRDDRPRHHHHHD
ncbi:MAG: hypothetical protein ACAI35_26920 [Candidatus Methylacidiphilales bacterium]|nr:hypothetical protein [Candidatus Methylacidiphilales bacterium]HSI86294.1 hypothetical protein [Candidatus Methylacidiphilales bacterium]